jgi:hypothetical protein
MVVAMKHLIPVLLVAAVVLVTVAAVGPLSALVFAHAPSLVSNSMRVVSERVDIPSWRLGYVSRDAVYETNAHVPEVMAFYLEQQIEPEHGMDFEGQCVRLARLNGFVVVRQTVVVTLCPRPRGTMVIFQQTVYLRPQ